jgi:NADPH:quinone reductase
MTELMRALLFDRAATDSSATRVATMPRPDVGAGEVLIDVTHAGVNFKDVMSRRGDPGYVARWPHVPGIEVAGTVTEVGDDVVGLRVGERVVALTDDGGLAEVAVAPAKLTVPIPTTLDPGVAAAAPAALASALLLLDLGHLGIGEALLIHSAAGTVGRAVAQLARHRGVGRLVGTVGHPARMEAALANGYDEIVSRDGDPGPVGLADGGCGFDLILDPQGTRFLDTDIAVAAPGARIIIFGNAAGEAPGPVPGLSTLFAKNLSLGAFSLKALAATDPGRVRAAIESVLTLLDQGVLSTSISYLDGLEATPAAQQALSEGAGRGKFIVALE